MKRYAVIPTRGGRVGTLRACLERIGPQVDEMFLIDNSDDLQTQPRVIDLGGAEKVANLSTVGHIEQPPNLSALWNLGLRLAATRAQKDGEDHFVAVLNDDAIVPDDWFDSVVVAMQRYDCAAGGYCGADTFAIHVNPGPTPLHLRMPGHAFILDGRLGLLADEQFHWWCGDNDLDMQARQVGGTVVLAGEPVKHLFPDKSTAENPVLQARTGEDMRLFVEKWGFRPW